MSIRERLVASHFVLVLAVVLLIGVVSLGLVRGFILRSATATLTEQAEQIAGVLDRRVFLPDDRAGLPAVGALVRIMSQLTGADVLVLTSTGRVLVTSERLRSLLGGVFLADRVADALEEGRTVSETFRDPLGRLSVIVVSPLPGDPGAAGTAGAVALVKPVVEVGRTLERLLVLFTAASLAGLVLSLVVSLLLARTLTRPLRALETAATRVAAGDFEHRVPVTADELGRVAAAFNSMAARLGQLQRERQELYASVSHELRTPVTSIKGFAQAVQDGVGSPEDKKRHLAIIQEEAARLERLVTDLFQLSRLEAGQVSFEWTNVDLSALVTRAVSKFGPRAEDGGVALVLEGARPEQSPGPLVRGDPDRLEQVLANLLENALRFTPQGGRVTVRLEREPGPREVVVSVEDTGPGIPPEDLERVFDRFYTVDRSRARRKAGTGLGLAIAREIVEAHGGRIWADRGADGGALVSVALPLTGGQPGPAGAPAASVARPAGGGAGGDKGNPRR